MKIILAGDYCDYEAALQTFSLDTLYERRQKRMLKFAIKCTEDKNNSKLFPKNHKPIGGEVFQVNFARTTKYQKSAIPQCQHMLNNHEKQKSQK